MVDGGSGDDILGLFAFDEADSAGIDESEALSAPFGFGGYAVTGDAGAVVDDGDTASDDPVKEGGFTDVWATDDGDKAWHGREHG
ncbi:MAG: hypothetical protein RI897_2964 [Verrucomicrobiota bacterium]